MSCIAALLLGINNCIIITKYYNKMQLIIAVISHRLYGSITDSSILNQASIQASFFIKIGMDEVINRDPNDFTYFCFRLLAI